MLDLKVLLPANYFTGRLSFRPLRGASSTAAARTSSILARVFCPLADRLAFLRCDPALRWKIAYLRSGMSPLVSCSQISSSLSSFLLGRVAAPFRKVHRLPRLVNIVGDHPRHRRDIAVPGPRGFVGVAVLAGSLEDCLHVRRHRWLA